MWSKVLKISMSAVILVIGALVIFTIPFLINYEPPSDNVLSECRQLPTASTKIC